MSSAEMQSAVISARSVVETNPFDLIEAARVLQRLAVLAPPHVEPMVHKAGQAIAKSIAHSGSGYDTQARYDLKQVVRAIERSFLRLVK